MAVLSNLEPKGVFHFFEKICSIPHGSGNTKAISDYLVNFAKSKNLEVYQDDADNVIIIKEASNGYENCRPVILQSHIDMVCEKEADCTKDMATEAIELVLDGDLISAKGTTLGADNGIGAAYALAVLDNDSINHPRIEAVFTSDEEVGMLGAFAIDVSPLKAKTMLNLDCGCEKVFTVSCAGGITSKSTFEIKREEYKHDTLKITISGLDGGHSGVMIDRGGANSNALMGRLLCELDTKVDIRIAHIEGGFKDNAIPVETTSVIVTADSGLCKSVISKALENYKNEYSLTDANLNVTVTEADYTVPMDKESGKRILAFLSMVPTGVLTMSKQIENLVQTSVNFAIINTFDTTFEAIHSARSSVDSQKYDVADRLAYFTKYLGGKVEVNGDYPGWEFKTESDLRKCLSEVVVSEFGEEPVFEAVHAGLECGLFSGKIPGLDCVSYGPDMWDVHTPRERLSVSSVKNVWKILCEFLKKYK